MKFVSEIFIDGKTYMTQPADSDIPLEALAEQFYENVEYINKAKFFLNDGSILILPKDAIQRAHVIFKEVT